MKNISLSFSIICLLIFGQFQTNAQNLNRLEIPVKNSDAAIFNIPLGEKGLIVLTQVSKTDFHLAKLDTDFHQNWTFSGNIDASMDYVTHSYDGRYVHLLFSRFKSNAYAIFRIDLSNGKYEKYQIYSVDRMEISNFRVLNKSVFIGGIINSQPMVLYTNLSQKSTRILPSVVKGQSEIQSMDIDTTQKLVNITYSSGNKPKNYQLIVRSFDEAGNQYNQIVMEPNDEFAMMNAKSNQLNDSLQVVVGTYGHKNTIGSSKGPTSQGMFFASFLDGTVQNSKFYSFTKFQNFFNFLGEKQKEKQEKKIKSKEDKGEDLRLDYRFIVHDIIKQGDQYLVVAESFYADYKYAYSAFNPYGTMYGVYSMPGYMLSPYSFYSPWSMLYSPFRWGYGNYGLYSPFSSYYSPWGYRGYGSYGNQQQFDGWVYTHGIIMSFDKDGNLLWDKSIDLKNTKEDKLTQKVKTLIQGDQIILSYAIGNQIVSKTIPMNGADEKEEVHEIESLNENDKVKKTSKTELNYWYGNYFLANGFQNISNEDEGKRSVFYLNKINIK
ncbi:hypothetical protein EOJ36_01150 [Sandaracinomonas limnophila]|uniref:Uncharacterized protein n=1 Tax=Sandaracinomonas limnophila TaxID=1862386 RepID=A0A437PWK2_9BACT|nr:hypothetical protein [Sandaracinomonas limnophila]RVU26631.1 hypothetical protein EOJ36_01150 [Sandaracinomonas limnophila]